MWWVRTTPDIAQRPFCFPHISIKSSFSSLNSAAVCPGCFLLVCEYLHCEYSPYKYCTWSVDTVLRCFTVLQLAHILARGAKLSTGFTSPHLLHFFCLGVDIQK